MRILSIAVAALFCAIALNPSAASATGFQPFNNIAQDAAANSMIVPVHVPGRVHDELHAYGYDRVVYLSQFSDYDGNPVYKFSACKRHKKFRLKVNWNGEVMRKHRIGNCHDHSYGYDNYSYNDKYKYKYKYKDSYSDNDNDD